MDLRCVHCGVAVRTLFVQYSPGNIRLMKCENCKEVADEYIECETMILLIDLILHKQKAYRHLLYNTLNRHTVDFEGIWWKSSFVFLLLDACRILVLRRNGEYWGLSRSSWTSAWVCGKMLMDVLFENLVFICFLSIATRILLKSLPEVARYKDILLAIVVSSYFKVWEFPASVVFIIDGFVLSSNVVALKVVTHSAMARCIGVCFIAHASKFLGNRVLEVPLSISLRYFSILGC
ncbi:PREDICTED: protein arv1 homolog isoform X2 [Nelumbo nucifera]|uniref:Protein ARV n=1 Tax=Nelumbo nucifera TaxID=4432 RepID=A0A1U7Z1N5_NELNU|nr:PREDICTED: protein arv1 homolog isoform X2 [Nelumbo nucifera]